VQKVKRIVERPWGRRQRGGYIFLRSHLLEVLKKGEAVELDKVVVGAKQLQKLISLLPCEDCLLRANGNLEIETIISVPIQCKDGVFRMSFRKPNKGYRQFMSIVNGAWLPKVATRVVVLRPRKY